MGSNNRYDRFSLLDVFAIPAGMVGATNAYAAPEATEGVAQRDVVRRPVQRGETRVVETHPPTPERPPPPGWEVERSGGGTRRYRPPTTFVGAALQATVDRAWQVHRQLSNLLN